MEKQHDHLVKSAEALASPLDNVVLFLAGYVWAASGDDDAKLAKEKGYTRTYYSTCLQVFSRSSGFPIGL
jgi:hypothetical protein